MDFDKLLSITDSGFSVDIFTIIDSNPKNNENIGSMFIIDADGEIQGQCEEYLAQKVVNVVRETTWVKPVIISVEGQFGEQYRIFWDKMTKKFSAIILGGGHISQPLTEIIGMLNFNVTVVDDRPEFAYPARFPAAQKVYCQNFTSVFQEITIDKDTAVIIVTRGHRYDLDCLRATLDSEVRYLGMIGSKRRIAEIVKMLLEEGVPEDKLNRLRAPIGFDIKAETPEEIAVSVAAEVISVFRGGFGGSLSRVRERV